MKPKIKTRDTVKKTIKTLDKDITTLKKAKDNFTEIKNQIQAREQNSNEYATNHIENETKNVVHYSGHIRNIGNKSINTTKNKLVATKEKLKKAKTKRYVQKGIKSEKIKIKTSKQPIIQNTKKIEKETAKISQKALQFAKERTRRTYLEMKNVTKTVISSVKAIITATKTLLIALFAGGWVAVLLIVIIGLIGLLCGSFLGIFFSGEKTGSNRLTMKDVIAECNQDFSHQIEIIQNTNPHEEYILDGNMASWKDILILYTVQISNGKNEQEVVTMNDRKRQVLKQIFWDMNQLSSEVKVEKVVESGTTSNEMPKEIEKKVLHIRITSKTADEMKNKYHLNSLQINQYNELMKEDYATLWNGIIYGIDKGDYMSWRQRGAPWSNIRIGNTSSTIGDIGCLVTSIAILIQKSGVDTSQIVPFNPGTFVEALNKNGGFDDFGNLQYGAIQKVIPHFQYVDKVILTGKTKEEKLSIIKQYFNAGYFLTLEVKGATFGNQHWVAIIGIDGNDIIMVDPGTNQTNLWNTYEFSKTSQFNYFKIT